MALPNYSLLPQLRESHQDTQDNDSQPKDAQLNGLNPGYKRTLNVIFTCHIFPGMLM